MELLQDAEQVHRRIIFEYLRLSLLLSGYPNGYSKVTSYLDFITDVTGIVYE